MIKADIDLGYSNNSIEKCNAPHLNRDIDNKFSQWSFLLILFLFPSITSFALYAKTMPSIFNMEALKAIKSTPNNYPQLTQFLRDADSIVSLKPLSVLDKKRSFIHNKHYYCSISRYAWPNPSSPNGPYIIKDGIGNPEFSDYDGVALETIASRLKHLAVAYYLTGNNNYRNAAVNQIKIWFLDKRTRMLPNFEYAQVLPGYDNNKGQSYGLAELSRFTIIIESIMLLDQAKGLNRKEKRKLKAWFADFQKWILGSKQWHIISKVNVNNITSSSYLALAEMSLLTENRRIATKLTEEYKEKVIEKQIEEDGKQPSELTRTVGFGYSVGNLEGIIDFCLVMESLGCHVYRNNKKK